MDTARLQAAGGSGAQLLTACGEGQAMPPLGDSMRGPIALVACLALVATGCTPRSFNQEAAASHALPAPRYQTIQVAAIVNTTITPPEIGGRMAAGVGLAILPVISLVTPSIGGVSSLPAFDGVTPQDVAIHELERVKLANAVRRDGPADLVVSGTYTVRLSSRFHFSACGIAYYPAILPWLVGLPGSSSDAEVEATLSAVAPDGKTVLQRRYAASESWSFNVLYYNTPFHQKVIATVLLPEVMASFAADLAATH